MSRFPTAAERRQNLDSSLAVYFAANPSGVRSLLVNIISEIERLEFIIAQRYESLEAVEQSISDIEFETLESIFNAGRVGRATGIVGEVSSVSL